LKGLNFSSRRFGLVSETCIAGCPFITSHCSERVKCCWSHCFGTAIKPSLLAFPYAQNKSLGFIEYKLKIGKF
jgi:hypothetical protein